LDWIGLDWGGVGHLKVQSSDFFSSFLSCMFTVGGIVRQVFSPLISGGCVICCPSFDPSIFWALMAKDAFTWYYAAPTMHQLILQSHEPDYCPHPRLRMIANAAGGLLPSLALQLRNRFANANVLPSYGMTECMPISSPPASYELTKPGTSGVAVGPEVAILNLTTIKQLLPNEEGPICVRGEPCFRGYGKINNSDATLPESFLKDGWFNTGDLGYMDFDGYLYITGRSKEVINRGGEIISPMEVEEAVSSHPDILACAAFSAKHDVLQEVVGIVLVMKAHRPRLDLMSLHAHLGARLAAPKWPQCLVFLDGLPKSHTNKLLRVKLGSRFCLPELNDAMAPIQRTFEGKCPPQGTPLDTKIPVGNVVVSSQESNQKLKAALILAQDKTKDLIIVANSARPGSFVCHLYNIDCTEAIEAARRVLDGYAVPTHFIQADGPLCNSTGTLPEPTTKDALDTILQRACSSEPVDPVVGSVLELFVQLLKLDYLPGPNSNFFHLGGSSLLASQLASKIRKEFGVSCSGAEIFHHSTGNELAKMICKRRPTSDDTISTSSDITGSQDETFSRGRDVSDHGAPFQPKHFSPKCTWWAMLFQLVPMFVIFPIWQVTRYLLFFAALLRSCEVVPTDRNLGTFVLAYLAFHICWITITPLVFVVIKWTVIGRYRPGRYPIWSTYYLRWWFVDMCRQLFLRGIWGSNEAFLNFYYRLLGANIGRGARISLEADVAEFDLVTVGENAAVEMSTLRGFGVDNGAMFLGPVKVGCHASVGARSVVAPYTSVPDKAHLGPATSSFDVKSLDDKFARVNRRLLPEPNLPVQLFIGGPITFLVNSIAQVPPLLVLLWMLSYKDDINGAFNTPSDLMRWLCDPRRIPFYIGIRIARALVSPFFYMGAAICVKKLLIGKFEAGPRNTTSQWQLLRHHLAATLFSRKKIQQVVDIIGRHYELVSCLYRCLGAKVGKRVFWPGHQPVFSGEFELIEIGDDVVFGSRSLLFCTTSNTCEKVILCAGSNVSDNCVVLPGSVVGKNATMGSNSVCPEGRYLPEGSIWFGSKGGEPSCLGRGEEGKISVLPGMIASSAIPSSKLQMTGDGSTLRPFGKAFYKRQANYFVWPLSWIVFASVVIKIFIATFHCLPVLASLFGAAAILYDAPLQDRSYDLPQYHFVTIYFAVMYAYFWMNILRVFLWLGIELTAKWALLGQRLVGTYNYDTSSYAQRWELYQLICKVRKFSRFNFLQFFYGTPYMAYYFRWNGGNVGKDVCLYPAGADPFMPEPDLVVIGDGCVIDCASIVCHLNTRGNFDLMQIVLEKNCTLRGRSRIQQGVIMESGSQLLEKSVAMTGEIVEADSVWVGCPASWWFQYPMVNEIPSAQPAEETSEDFDETSKLLKGEASCYCV